MKQHGPGTARSKVIKAAEWLLPLFAVAVSCGPLLLHGFPAGHDRTFELVRVSEFQTAMASGQVPPAWAGNLYGGYGSPIFLFYAPLYGAVAAALSWLTGSVMSGAWLALVVMTVASAVSLHFLMRPLCDGTAASAATRIAVYVYVLHPYLLGDKLLRNANAEFAALCLMPIALAGVVMLGRRTRLGAVLLSAGIAATTLAHNLTALVAVVMVLVVAAWFYLPRPSHRVLGGLAAGLALGLAMALFFWLPAMMLKHLVRPEELLVGKFDFRTQFPSLKEVVYDSFFAMGWLTPVLFLVSLWALVRCRAASMAGRRVLGAMMAVSCVLAFLLTPASRMVWEAVPLMPFFQFPWRLIGPLALAIAVATGIAFALIMNGRSARLTWLGEGAVFAACVLTALPVLNHSPIMSDKDKVDLADLLSADGIRARALSATVGDEYLPCEADRSKRQHPMSRRWPVIHANARTRVSNAVDEGAALVFDIEAAESTAIELTRWYFPGWRATVDDRAVELRCGQGGRIELQVPRGVSSISLRYESPLVRRAGWYISLAALAVWGALAYLAFRRRRAK